MRRGTSVLLVNRASGSGEVDHIELAREANRRGIEMVMLRRSDDVETLAREKAHRAEIIGVAGGDGSQGRVAQVAIEHDLGFVCIPAGTRNHLALDLGLDPGDLVGALDAFTSAIERRIDVGYVNRRVFVNNVSLGLYAQIVQSEGYRDAKLETAQQMLRALLGPDAVPFDLSFIGPDGMTRNAAQLILISNNPYQLDRLAGIGSRPRLDTGMLGVVAIELTSPTEAGVLAALEMLGQVARSGSWTEWSTERFEVESHSPVVAAIDGEAVVLEPPLVFTTSPSTLRVRLPPSATGLSPAARRPSLSAASIRRLFTIAAGRPQ
jgi:diacylglycerol kinase family enzyme